MNHSGMDSEENMWGAPPLGGDIIKKEAKKATKKILKYVIVLLFGAVVTYLHFKGLLVPTLTTIQNGIDKIFNFVIGFLQ